MMLRTKAGRFVKRKIVIGKDINTRSVTRLMSAANAMSSANAMSATDDLKKVYANFSASLTPLDLQELANKCAAISRYCKGDGAGLAGGTLTDMLVCGFLQAKMADYSDCHTGESDLKIGEVPLSLKKINGKSTVALDWSKNENDLKKEHFSCHLVIINLKTQQWWKNEPTKKPLLEITWNDTIPAGIYLISKDYCKTHVQLGKNNKTNTLISDQYLYMMLKESLKQGLCLTMPAPNAVLNFDIMQAFSK
jgi:hypothetical protein